MDPFLADPISRTSVRLSWHQPSGGWSQFRLVRNRAGFPISINDGQTVYSQSSATPTPEAFVDGDLIGGWHYYAIFLLKTTTNEWLRVAIADALVPYDYNSTEKVWDAIPEYYKVITDNTANFSQALYRINPDIYMGNVSNGETVHNDNLLNFLNVFGWGIDILRSQVETILDGYNPAKVHVNRLSLLAEQFGATLEPVVPSHSNRNLVRNLALLYRKRGTPDGLREMIALATGWDVEVTTGPNQMLSNDQSDFNSPVIPNWDVGTKYATGDRVRYGLWYYQAIQPAFGAAQGPPVTRTNNAYWSTDNFVEPVDDFSINRTDTGDVSTWQVAGTSVTMSGGTLIGVGVIDPVDSSIGNANSLGLRNVTGSTQDMTLRSIPRYAVKLSAYDRQLVLESGVPVPRVLNLFSVSTQYYAGDRVLYRGAPYEAVQRTKTNLPTDTVFWKRLGIDSRVRMCLSFYTHGPFGGTAGAGGVPVYPWVATFDEFGDVIREVVLNPASYSGVIYDPFNTTGTINTGRAIDVGSTSWSANAVGSWTQGWDDAGGFAYPSATGRTYQTVTSTADTNVAVTFRSVGTRPLGIIFRRSDASNFWIATNAGLFKVVAGAAAANPASGAVSWTPFVAGDRMRVTLSGSTISVLKNGVVVGTATDSFNATATQHGIEMEA